MEPSRLLLTLPTNGKARGDAARYEAGERRTGIKGVRQGERRFNRMAERMPCLQRREESEILWCQLVDSDRKVRTCHKREFSRPVRKGLKGRCSGVHHP